MSSNDYTNLRRLRHVYYPSLNNCHPQTHHAGSHVQSNPNACYIEPHHHQNVHTHSHNSHGNTGHCQQPVVIYAEPQVHTHSNHSGYPGGPMSIVNYPPVIQSPSANCTNNNNNNSTNNNNNNCENCSRNNCSNNNQLTPCTHETNYIYPQTPVCYMNEYVTSSCVSNNACVPDKTTMSTTKKEYLITPTFSGSITFSIDCYLGFNEGMKVNCTSDASSNNYFEGVIYNYESSSGEITIYNLATINGSFNKQSKYVVSIIPAFQEVDKLRERMARVYLELFNEDISDKAPASNSGTGTDTGTDTGTVTEANKTSTKTIFTYFFNEDITGDSNYADTETYYTEKVEYTYDYFFGNTTTNPNNNGVSLDTLQTKIEQLNLYFFGNTNPTITI